MVQMTCAVLAVWLCFSPVPLQSPSLGASPAAEPSHRPARQPESVPPIFSIEAVDAAIARAQAANLYVLVDATSKNCPPCRRMDRTTWIDTRVEAWVRKHGVAVRLDVDRERALSAKHEIDAMPTVIVLRDGKELDRATGYQSAQELLAWLEDVKAGKNRLDAVRTRAGSRTGPRVDIEARYRLASELALSGKHDEAADELVWLWKNMLAHDPAYSGVRGSFMAGEMEQLARKHPPAKKLFEQLRAESAGGRDRDDWIVLNGVVGDDAATLAWFDKARKDLAQLPVIRRSGFRLDNLLIAAGRWADVAVLYEDPLHEVQQAHHLLELSRTFGGRADMEELDVRMFHDKVAQMHAALLAAGRDAEAKAVVGAALKLRDSEPLRAAIVAKALEAGQPREVHLTWTKDRKLVERVRKALGK